MVGTSSGGAMVVKTNEGWEAYPAIGAGVIGCFKTRDDATAVAEMIAASLNCCADDGDDG